MKLASKMGTNPDGRLLIVGRDLASCVEAESAPTLQYALDNWSVVQPELVKQSAALIAGRASGATPVNLASLGAAMPRSFQFLDASAFLAHNHILAAEINIVEIERRQRPIVLADADADR